MGYIFISYSRQQLYFAESVTLHLQQAGFETWFDLQELAPGQSWEAALEEGYGNCEKLVLVASQAAVRSPYVQVEWETALRDGRDVIVVLAEAVDLPEPLRGCPVYDARRDFDQAMESLAASLRGEGAARYDPAPAPGKSILPARMPFDIWFTLSVLLMPTITVWIAGLTFPLNWVEVDFELPAIIETYLPGIIKYIPHLLGLFYGFNLAHAQLPVGKFLRHEVSYEELESTRWKLLGVEMTACLACLVTTVLIPRPGFWYLAGYLIFIFPLATAYWSFRSLRNSPDLLRWLPSGQADQDVREGIQGKLAAAVRKQQAVPGNGTGSAAVLFALHFHPADRHIAAYIESLFRAHGCQPTPEGAATHQLVIVSNRTSKHWLLERDASLPGQVIHILATNINTPEEIQPVLDTQWVDFRSERRKILQALAAYLTGKEDSNVTYGMQISPTGFDNNYGFPRWMRIVLGTMVLAFIIPVALVSRWFQLPDWSFFPAFVLFLLYIDALGMRKACLPPLLHKLLGYRVAWFASPATRAPDPIGNTDRKYMFDRKFLLLDVFLRE